MEFVRVGALAEIPDGELRAYELPFGRVAVAHLGHRLYAVGDTCTHAGCPVSEGSLSDTESAVVCSCHRSVFDLATGEPIDGPATDPLAIYPVRTDDGWVEVATEAGTDP
ncbi:MAG: Rieske 2Fe-2S domain-containing protein [Actinomycetota bacterium]